jgi:chromosomal replication initiation ATPase DnaA
MRLDIFEKVFSEEENAGIWIKLDTKFKREWITSDYLNKLYETTKQKNGKANEKAVYSDVSNTRAT